MSKGLGRIEHWIADEIARSKEPVQDWRQPMPVHVHSWSLAYNFNRLHESDWSPSRAQRAAVARAMHSFVRKFPQYALAGGKGRKMLYLYEPADPLSTAWVQFSIAHRAFVSLSDVRAHLRQRMPAAALPRDRETEVT
jgi:hypothetical protein